MFLHFLHFLRPGGLKKHKKRQSTAMFSALGLKSAKSAEDHEKCKKVLNFKKIQLFQENSTLCKKILNPQISSKRAMNYYGSGALRRVWRGIHEFLRRALRLAFRKCKRCIFLRRENFSCAWEVPKSQNAPTLMFCKVWGALRGVKSIKVLKVPQVATFCKSQHF